MHLHSIPCHHKQAMEYLFYFGKTSWYQGVSFSINIFSVLQVPMLVPGLNYAFETFVQCMSDKGISDTIKVSGHVHHLEGLTHWGRVTHICDSKLTIIGSDNGLSPGCHIYAESSFCLLLLAFSCRCLCWRRSAPPPLSLLLSACQLARLWSSSKISTRTQGWFNRKTPSSWSYYSRKNPVRNFVTCYGTIIIWKLIGTWHVILSKAPVCN